MAVGYDPRASNSGQLEEDLAAVNDADRATLTETQAREQQYAQELEAESNQERQQSRLDNLKDKAKQQVKQFVKKEVKQLAKKYLKRVATRTILVNPYFWIAVAIVFIVVCMVVIFFMTSILACNNPEDLAGGGWKGKLIVFSARTVSRIISPGTLDYFDNDLCPYFVITSKVANNTQPALGTSPAAGQDLVPISGIPTAGSLNARLRPCMQAHIELVYRQAQAQRPPINFVITSAYRPGAIVAGSNPPRLSSHARGEAIDVQIVPSGSLNDDAFQAKIARLIGLFETEGFSPPPGDTLDEYNDPTEGATGGHIHVEYNSPVNGRSYCTNPTNYDE